MGEGFSTMELKPKLNKARSVLIEKIKLKIVPMFSLALILFLTLMFQNCSMVSPPNSSSADGSFSASAIYEQQALSILGAKCSGCHNQNIASGGISNITDVNYLLFYRLVIPGQPEISDIVRVIKDGSMPPSGPLSNADLEAISQWILKGFNDTTGVTVPGGGSSVLLEQYSSLATKIFTPKCVGCHNANTRDGGVDLSSYNAVRNEVIPGNPAGSNLIMAVERTGNNYMPQGGARLSADEISKMKLWIQNGAANN